MLQRYAELLDLEDANDANIYDEPFDIEYFEEDPTINQLNMSLDDIVDSMIESTTLNPDEIQSPIAKNVFFRYNSVNLVLGKRASGKTFNVLRELVKLPVLNHGEFKQIFYITNKFHDDTVEKIKPAFEKVGMKFTWVDTSQALETIQCIEMLKQMLAEPEFLEAYPEAADALATTIGYSSYREMSEILRGRLPHTIILFDDCLGLFKKDTALAAKLFQNRQSRITYFLMLQDITGISSSIKGNIDSLMLFGGFSSQKLNVLKQQIEETGYSFDDYRKLQRMDYVWIDFKTHSFETHKSNFEEKTNGHVKTCESSGISNGKGWRAAHQTFYKEERRYAP